MAFLKLHKTYISLLAIFIILTICLSTGGYILYLHQKSNITQGKNNELAVINKLEIEQIVNWRNNLLTDARTIFYNQPVITHIHEFNLGIDTKSNQQIISKWGVALLKEFEYTKVLLVNPDGKVILNSKPDELLTEAGKKVIGQAVKQKEIVFSDFNWYNDKTICIFIAIPLYLEVDTRTLFSGVALVNINPENNLFPLIKRWPTPSLTGETLIYRREGDSVLVLNDLRHYKNGALRLRKPMTDTLLPAIRAAMGFRGIVDGVDYRGVKVLADLDTIEDSHWLIVTKIDTDEIFQPIHKQALWVLIITFLLIFVSAFIIYIIWVKQSSKSEQERLALLKHFDYLVKYANDIVILSDFNGDICEANDKTISEYGYSRDEILNMNIRQLRAPEAKNLIEKQLDLIKENDGIIYETLHIRKNGEIFPIESSGRRMEVDGITYYHFIVRDITERKKTQEDLIKAKEKAEEGDRLKTAFLNNLSHEIRTPLNGILGFSGLLDDETLTQEDRNYYVKIINDNGIQLLSIINDIIDISQIQSGQLILNPVNFSLLDLFDELYTTFEQEKVIKKKTNIELILELESGVKSSTIYTDKERLKQIFYNLLSNALKFTKTGFIKFGYSVQNEKLLFFVQDSGKGIAKEKQALIFERFRQEEVTYTREFGGTGLGLTISKELVKLLGGVMCLESEEGVGTTVFFNVQFSNESIEIIENVVFQKKEDGHKGKLKILIAEDDENSRLLLDLIVKKYSKENFHAKNGLEAVEVCRNHPDLDLILLDIQMPEMNGYIATKEIRKFNKTVIIIAQTAFIRTDDREKALEAGCNEYITKPINKTLLKELVTKHFGI